MDPLTAGFGFGFGIGLPFIALGLGIYYRYRTRETQIDNEEERKEIEVTVEDLHREDHSMASAEGENQHLPLVGPHPLSSSTPLTTDVECSDHSPFSARKQNNVTEHTTKTSLKFSSASAYSKFVQMEKEQRSSEKVAMKIAETAETVASNLTSAGGIGSILSGVGKAASNAVSAFSNHKKQPSADLAPPSASTTAPPSDNEAENSKQLTLTPQITVSHRPSPQGSPAVYVIQMAGTAGMASVASVAETIHQGMGYPHDSSHDSPATAILARELRKSELKVQLLESRAKQLKVQNHLYSSETTPQLVAGRTDAHNGAVNPKSIVPITASQDDEDPPPPFTPSDTPAAQCRTFDFLRPSSHMKNNTPNSSSKVVPPLREAPKIPSLPSLPSNLEESPPPPYTPSREISPATAASSIEPSPQVKFIVPETSDMSLYRQRSASELCTPPSSPALPVREVMNPIALCQALRKIESVQNAAEVLTQIASQAPSATPETPARGVIRPLGSTTRSNLDEHVISIQPLPIDDNAPSHSVLQYLMTSPRPCRADHYDHNGDNRVLTPPAGGCASFNYED